MRHAPIRRLLRLPTLAAVLVLSVLILAAVPTPAPAQSSSAALGEAMAAELERPLTPPEAWAVQQTVRDHLGRVRAARDVFARRLAAATGLAPERIVDLLPPLGRGTLSAEADPVPALEEGFGRALTEAEEQALAAAAAERDAALAPHRDALVERLAALTELDAARILPLLPGLGL